MWSVSVWEVSCKGAVVCFPFWMCIRVWKGARTQRELESSDSTRTLPTQTWTWLLLWSNKNATGRQSAPWLRASLISSSLQMCVHTTLGIIQVSLYVLCMLKSSLLAYHHGDLKPHVEILVEGSDWFILRIAAFNCPHYPPQIIWKGRCH